MKKTPILLLSSIFFLFSCSQPSKPINRLEKLLQETQQGFTLNATSTQRVKKAKDGEKLYDNEKKYLYLFDNLDRSRIKQTIEYKDEHGKTIKDSIQYVRNDEGFLGKEYINAQNEVDIYLYPDSDGSYIFYDDNFLNPFKLLYESDFIQDETDEDLYHLNPIKMNRFEYYTIATGKPVKDITFKFESDSLKHINIISVELEGKAYDYSIKEYVQAKWDFSSTLTLSDYGTTKVSRLTPYEKSKNHDEIQDILKKVGNNFTLKEDLCVKGSTEGTHTVTYSDGNTVYRDSDITVADLTKDYVFKKDPFKEDNLLYQYVFDKDTSTWNYENPTNITSYNVNPSDISYFAPKLTDISPDIFTKDGNTYKCDDVNIFPYLGNSFLPDFVKNPMISFGLGLEVSFMYLQDTNELRIEAPFIYPMSGDLYEFTYSLTYSDIGTTTVPIEL